jgi:hypothetical protein
MCFDICTIDIRVSIRVRGPHLIFSGVFVGFDHGNRCCSPRWSLWRNKKVGRHRLMISLWFALLLILYALALLWISFRCVFSFRFSFKSSSFFSNSKFSLVPRPSPPHPLQIVLQLRAYDDSKRDRNLGIRGIHVVIHILIASCSKWWTKLRQHSSDDTSQCNGIHVILNHKHRKYMKHHKTSQSIIKHHEAS